MGPGYETNASEMQSIVGQARLSVQPDLFCTCAHTVHCMYYTYIHIYILGNSQSKFALLAQYVHETALSRDCSYSLSGPTRYVFFM